MKSPSDHNAQRMVNVRVAEKKLLTFDSSLGSGWEPLKVAIHYKHHKSPQSVWALARTVKSQPLNFERSPTSSPDVQQEMVNVDRDTDDDDLYTMQGHHTFDDENVSRHLVDSTVDPPLSSTAVPVTTSSWGFDPSIVIKSPAHELDTTNSNISEQQHIVEEVVEPPPKWSVMNVRRVTVPVDVPSPSSATMYPCLHKGCSAQLKSAVALRKHKLVHKPKSVACDVCGATFREHTKMRRHMVVHNNEKPFKCTHEGCDQAFAHQWNLKMHERIHTDERHYSCSTCGKAFVQLSNMRAHERNVHKKVSDAVTQEDR